MDLILLRLRDVSTLSKLVPSSPVNSNFKLPPISRNPFRQPGELNIGNSLEGNPAVWSVEELLTSRQMVRTEFFLRYRKITKKIC